MVRVNRWKDRARRLKDRIQLHNVSLLAAGVALYFLLALIPALAATISIFGLVAEPDDVQRDISDLAESAPPEVQDLLTSQLERLASSSGSSIGLGLVIGLAFALWAASAGMRHLMGALNVCYGEIEGRGLLRLIGRSLVFTLGGILVFGAAIGVIGVIPQITGHLGVLRPVARFVPYLLLAVVFVFALAIVYRYGPDRASPMRWVSWGAAAATALWIVASALFSFYVSNFGSYNETYGSLAAVVILILWLMLTSYAILLGAELNADLEHGGEPEVAEGHRSTS